MPYAPDIEIFDLLSQRLKAAAEKCEHLAWHPRRGFIYAGFCKDLKEIEGCCRQIYLRREDARYLQSGMQAAKIHKMCGNWLRISPTKETRNAVHPLFKKTGEILRAMAYGIDKIRHTATGVMRPILPAPLAGPQRDTRPVSVKTPGGLILPPTYH